MKEKMASLGFSQTKDSEPEFLYLGKMYSKREMATCTCKLLGDTDLASACAVGLGLKQPLSWVSINKQRAAIFLLLG